MGKDKSLKETKNDQLVNQGAGITGAHSFNFLNYVIQGKNNSRDHLAQRSHFSKWEN